MPRLKKTEKITSAHVWYKNVTTFYGTFIITTITFFIQDTETLKRRVIEKELL